MSDELGTPYSTTEGPTPSAPPPKKRNTALIVAVVVLLILCLCCAFILVMYFWLGDLILEWLKSQGIQIFMLQSLA